MAGNGNAERDRRAELWSLPNPSGLNAKYQLEDLPTLFRAAANAAGLALGRRR